eukprot:gnl/TRDRNA2_/TRDRNA2_162957_c1_seq3.p1 gnl/TRDRNA2_/TRDRNA2_162957_c1~~gnl/TRDRNA2_/TRDRNA2_162957_c1_seq3.p1  ORF type:complete len:795 (-),score=174.13 gnl/TRDRNA2_/TRDRNA2_162957_c1_seq3:97-2223(-)
MGGESLMNMMQDGSAAKFDDAWYQRQVARLGKDGMGCTKVASNGKPYERRVHLEPRNNQIEIRGGRKGSTGVLLDDLVDVRQGLCSPEFEKFCQRFKKDIMPPELTKRACVLQTPSRTFSFLFSAESQRNTVAYVIVYLLKAKHRDLMATGVGSTPSDKVPKEGFGTVTYPNRSTYEGHFHNSMRHGHGTLTLSDNTKYECEWKNDERFGRGKEFWADGTTFVGSYVKGMRSGHGVMTWPEGSKYSGQFERGKANGQGKLLRTDGSVYEGHFSEDCMCGDGTMTWKDGVRYTGQFLNNMRDGVGKMAWAEGKWKFYDGHWKVGVQHGKGTLVNFDEEEFLGLFSMGKLEKWLGEDESAGEDERQTTTVTAKTTPQAKISSKMKVWSARLDKADMHDATQGPTSTKARPVDTVPERGHGEAKYVNGSKYVGEFEDSQRHGKGTLTFATGTRFECSWLYDERHGSGEEYWQDGTRFTGSYLQGLRCGHGVMSWPEGSKYSGQFERGKANGQGRLLRTDGSVYEGHFSEDCMCGEGCMRWRDGVIYSGQFLNNMRDGTGKMTWNAGKWRTYDGGWKDGVQHGYGELVDESQQKLCGQFSMGKLEKTVGQEKSVKARASVPSFAPLQAAARATSQDLSGIEVDGLCCSDNAALAPQAPEASQPSRQDQEGAAVQKDGPGAAVEAADEQAQRADLRHVALLQILEEARATPQV